MAPIPNTFPWELITEETQPVFPMPHVRVDILTVIRYASNEPDKTCIFTNAKKEALEEIISTWVQDQIGRGRDSNEPINRDLYVIKIGLGLEDDSFATESNTGNKDLTCGIVMDVLCRLSTLTVKGLSELPKT